ncbi:unnamed protein product [Kuraishia capsulata CBS 1993]|uniref:BTB domain-containing protein n=1 Tax=Kuraishia capsulata CBS 1993 TaxID=1382522 RepID=W6MVS7_9ASCO|nr:uncharacterized protein KUCA_T00002447001 [Kuraishia capsulata CBS 1993]CDK26475.1 unnamed protein product [Kuraishia capsulata CBS 1993]
MDRGTESKEFVDLLLACRSGDLDRVDQLVSLGINVDRWDNSPLILASLCGHEDVVRFLLERGAVCDRDTFEGERCVYGALNDSIRDLLLSYDITKAVDVTQPFAAHISSLVPEAKVVTADILVNGEKLHKFMLSARGVLKNISLVESIPSITTKIVNYVYQKPQTGFERINLEELLSVAVSLDLTDFAEMVREYRAATTPISRSKVMRNFQLEMSRLALKDMSQFTEDQIFAHALVKDTPELSVQEKLDMMTGKCFPDVILTVPHKDGGHWFVPSHRAILVRSEYFETMFRSNFSEASIFNDLVSENGIIDRNRLIEDPDLIPVIPVTAASNSNLLRILIEFLYYDNSTFVYFESLDVLSMADALLIDRLKNMASVVLSSDGDNPRIPVYDILRAGWDTRINRLETYAARVIANRLEEYINEPDFEDVVLESAERIENRHDTDTIDLIDDIRFYLTKKFHITNYEGYDVFFKDVVKDDPALYRDYTEQLAWIDDLLARLGLDA